MYSTAFVVFELSNQAKALRLASNSTGNVTTLNKAVIEKTSQSFNTDYFRNRSIEKNALAISSDQSATIESFDIVKNNYNKCLANEDLKKCPDHWGGFSFTPYYFEFWKGDKNRLNEREAFTLLNNEWLKSILQP